MSADATALLLDWFDGRERDVRWRGEEDPYAILVAEVMAQQTRIETVAPYYLRFRRRFPDVTSLAESTEDEVLKAWEGLGYYARARNLRRAAQVIVAEHGGEVPRDPSALRELPGVGPYTTGAVASLAFGRPEPAIDGNARRVLARLFDIAEPTPKRLDRAARRLLDGAAGRAGAVNQAIMDLGSEICRPRRPGCAGCPVSASCLALRRGTVALRPPAVGGSAKPRRHEAAAVVRRARRLLVVRRPAEGLLGGLWDFPTVALDGEQSAARALACGLERRLGVRVELGEEIRVVRHTFSHFRLHLVVHDAAWLAGEVRTREPFRWADRPALDRLAFPAYQRRLISETLSLEGLPR